MNIQMIDEFRRRTNASYDEARYYLERHNGDLLEAIIAFERERAGYQNQAHAGPRSGSFVKGLIRALQKLFDIKLVITDKNHNTFPVPIIIPLVLFPVWHVIFLMAVVMMIMGFRFSFQEAPDANVNVESIVNKVKDKVKESGRTY